MDLGAMWPYALAAVLLLAIIILVLLVLLLKRASKAAEYPEPGDEAAEEEPKPEAAASAEDADDDQTPEFGMRTAFRRALRLVRRGSAADRHDVPLFLLAGAARSRDNDLLATTGLELPFGEPAAEKMSLGKGNGFWFFDRGVVLDVAGDTILRADGKTGDDSRWESLLRHLEKFRPRRPIDGVILTISAAELADVSGDELRRADFAARAGRIYRRLADAQQRLGFRLPTYVVVTGCQALTGFTSLCASVTSESRQEILGWSNPNALDAAYRGAWVDDAFNAVTSRLEDIELEVFAEGTMHGDTLLQLPDGIRRLAAPLRMALDAIFKPSAYHGALLLRGIYFCGREEVTGRTAFTADLIERKVFAESALATPTARTILARNRSVRTARNVAATLAVLVTTALVWGYIKFAQQNQQLDNFLKTSTRAAQTLDANAVSDEKLQELATQFITGLAKIDFGHYGAAVIPSSWPIFSNFRDELHKAIQVAFRQVIFQAIDTKLQKRALALQGFEYSLKTDTPLAAAAVASPTETPEFLALRNYVQDVVALDTAVTEFNHVATSDKGNLQQLGDLIKYTFGLNVTAKFFKDSALYESALRDLHYDRESDGADYSKYRETATRLSQTFLARVFDNNAFAGQLSQLGDSVRALSTTSAWPAGGDTAPYAAVTQQMRDVELSLSNPSLEWEFRHDFSLGMQFEDVVRQMKQCTFLGQDVAMQVSSDARNRWAAFRQTRLAVETPLTNRILATDPAGDPTMHLSADSLMLKTALETFLGESFVNKQNVQRQLEWRPQSSMRLVWDAAVLQRAAAVSGSYDRFRDTTLRRFPAALQPSIVQVARDRARREMVDVMADAATYEQVAPSMTEAMLEDDVRNDVARFTTTTNDVAAVLDGFAHIEAYNERSSVADVETTEAMRVLQRVDRLLQNDAPYRVRLGNFSWWDGNAPPSPVAWGAADAGELAGYVEVSRARVALLSRNYAQPLLAWFARAQVKDRADVRDLASKWEGISNDLRDYDAKKPGNAVSRLEDYITGPMTKVLKSNCTAATLGTVPRGAHGFFWSSLSSLSLDLASRCSEVAGSDAETQYSELAKYFNQRLAGRYPFSDTLPVAGDPEADPDDIRYFFRQYDASRLVGDIGSEYSGPRQFVDDVAKVRAFMAPFLESPNPATRPAWDVEPTFRVLADRETGGNQIIEWKFGVDNETAVSRERTKKIRWSTGKPVRITLRWAADAPAVPVNAGGGSAGSVSGRTVTYEYRNRWSLFMALAEHRAAAQLLPKFTDSDPVTLGFSIPTQVPGAATQEKAQVFLRLALLAPGTTQPLDLPRFPSRAPKLEKPLSTAQVSR